MKSEDQESAKKSVGRRAAEIRQALGLTQAGLAARMSDDASARVTPQYVGLIEQGRENLTIDALVRIANSLGVPLRALFDTPASMVPKRPGRPRREEALAAAPPASTRKRRAPR